MSSLKIKKPSSTILLLFSLIIIGLILRFYKLEERFNFDGELNVKAWTITSALNKLIYHQLPTLVGIEAVSYLHHLFYPPLFIYLGSLIFLAFGGHPLSVEVCLILLSAVSMFLIYRVVYKLKDEKTAFVASLLYAFSFFLGSADRFIWVVGPLLPLGLTAVLILINLVKSKGVHRRDYLLLGAVLGIAFNFHYQAAIIFLSSLIFLFCNKSINFKKIGLFFIPIIIAFLPLIIFDLRHNFFNFQGLQLLLFSNKTNSFSQNLENTNLQFWQPFVAIFSDTLKNFLAQQNSHLISTLLNSLIILSPWLVFFKEKGVAKKIFGFIALSFTLALCAFPFIQNRYYGSQYYLYFLLPFFIIVVSILLRRLPKIVSPYLPALFVAAFSLVNIIENFSYSLPQNYQEKSAVINKIISSYHRKFYPDRPLSIHFKNIDSLKYSYLIYFLAKQYSEENNINISFALTESWQKEDALFTIAHVGNKILVEAQD